MKWLADYTDVSEYSTKEYCDRMTATGSKVEGWEELETISPELSSAVCLR